MYKEQFHVLDKNQIEYFKSNCEIINIPVEFDIIYENQVPSTCFILIEGKVELYKGRRKTKTAPTGTFIGLKNLLNHSPVKNTYRILGPAKIISFNRTMLLEILKNEAGDFHEQISGVLHLGK